MRFLALFLVVVVAAAHVGHACRVLVALEHRQLDVLEKRLLAISDPESTEYGHFASASELAQHHGITDEDFSHLHRELSVKMAATDITLSSGRDYLKATVPRTFCKDDAHHVLSARAQALISFVLPKKPLKSRLHRKGRSKLQIWQEDIIPHWRATHPNSPLGSPNAQRQAYGIPSTQQATHPRSKQMVWGPGTFGFRDSDLSQFYSSFSVNASVSTLHHLGYLGVPGGDNFGEGTLDTTYISSLGQGATTINANTDNSSSAEESTGFGPALLDFTFKLGNMSDDQLPLVLSMSLGSLSWDSCNFMCEQAVLTGKLTMAQCLKYVQDTQRQVCMFPTQPQQDRINVEFMKLGARGVSLVSATGDGGSHYSFQPFTGINPGYDQILNNISCVFNFPTFPSVSPWVTGVGGTQWNGDPTTPVPWTASGGGFSWRYAQPSYQSKVVSAYLTAQGGTSGFPPPYAFNKSARAYPDVAALASDVPLVVQGQTFAAGGTSASTPAFAGVVSLINDVRLHKGLPQLGFLNPRLYKIAAEHPGEALYDMTTGSSACSSSGSCCSTGFPAAKGWDPTTGLGSPLWAGLIKYLGSD